VKSVVIAAALVVAACHPAATSGEAEAVARVAARDGVAAPAGALTDASGAPVQLHDVFAAHAETVLVFYRGFY